MGYTTNFGGQFGITPALRPADKDFLIKLSQTRRMGRKGLDPKYGIEGEFYVEATGHAARRDDDANIIDYNKPPMTQPGLWCQWIPNADGTALQWDGNEKFYEYTAWILYIIDCILKPRGYVVNGEVDWTGEDEGDKGIITVKNNEVFTSVAETVQYGKPKKVQWVGPGEVDTE